MLSHDLTLSEQMDEESPPSAKESAELEHLANEHKDHQHPENPSLSSDPQPFGGLSSDFVAEFLASEGFGQEVSGSLQRS